MQLFARGSRFHRTAESGRIAGVKRAFELVLLYVGLPAAMAFLPGWAERRWGVRLNAWVVPTLLLAATIAYAWMRRTGLLARGELTRLRVADHLWAEMLARFVLSALLLTWLLSQFRPEWLFAFPRHNPRFWALVCVAYPLVSVLPQGILYRALWTKRYAACVPRHPILFGALQVGASSMETVLKIPSSAVTMIQYLIVIIFLGKNAFPRLWKHIRGGKEQNA